MRKLSNKFQLIDLAESIDLGKLPPNQRFSRKFANEASVILASMIISSPPAKPPTLDEVARMAGLSKPATCEILNGEGLRAALGLRKSTSSELGLAKVSMTRCSNCGALNERWTCSNCGEKIHLVKKEVVTTVKRGYRKRKLIKTSGRPFTHYLVDLKRFEEPIKLAESKEFLKFVLDFFGLSEIGPTAKSRMEGYLILKTARLIGSPLFVQMSEFLFNGWSQVCENVAAAREFPHSRSKLEKGAKVFKWTGENVNEIAKALQSSLPDAESKFP